ncbi:MAG TPA: hypothetical protein VGN43_16755, partial [Steroidobacteraceae bacterium]|nr:hypothetical protein [Steroidobacteraceae bacterium]
MLLRSLRLRILGTVALVLVVAIATVEVTAQQVTTRGFVSYVGNVNKQEQLTLSKVLTMYRQSADPAAVQQVIDSLAAADGRRIVFIGLDHRVIADSAHELAGKMLNCAPPALTDCLGASPGDVAASALVISAAPPGPDVARAVPAKALPPKAVWISMGH